MTDGVTRRTASKMALAGLVTAKASSAQATLVTIVAVAIGPSYRQTTINAPESIPSWVRRYINGFVDGMAPTRTLGPDYVIDYRECPAATLGTQVFTSTLQSDYILGLSTTVVRAAAQSYTAGKRIVGIVSRPEDEEFFQQENVCGVSAGRSNDAHLAYRSLLNSVSPALSKESATLLYDPNYRPSQDARVKIRQVFRNPYPPEQAVQNVDDVRNWMTNNAQPQSGVLLLPIDWMFGSAANIIQSAVTWNVLDFWFVTDWVVPSSPGVTSTSAFGGYGVPQETAGRYLGNQLNNFWSGSRPSPPWLPIPQQRVWKVSRTRAGSLTPNPQNPPAGPEKVN